MKKYAFLFALVALFTTNVMGQTPWKIVDMEDVSRHGGNAEYDDETTTATFKGEKDRWIDLPGIKGDISEHTNLVVNVEQADCVLKFAIRYKDANGKAQQAVAATLYGRMGKGIDKPTALKIDLSNKGKIGDDVLKNVIGIRVAMAKPAAGKEQPWRVKFGEVALY